MNSHKEIVITGASEFLGSHLVKRLKGKRCEVIAMSSKPDKLDVKTLKGSAIINCVYPRICTGAAIADGLKYIQKVFENAAENQAVAIINISSQSVYSQQRMEAVTEATPVCLESPYTIGKYSAELLLDSICKDSDTQYTNLRMASLIGQGFDQRILNRLSLQAIEKKYIIINRNNKKWILRYR